VSKISELSDGGSLVSSDYLIAVRSGGNVKVRMDQINVDQVDLGDNEFIRLGNSQDLTMVHTSTQSIINQAGIGDLLIQKAGATKLTINASGIDVTGSVTATTATGSASPTPTKITIATSTSAGDWSTTAPWGRLAFYSADASAGGAKEEVTLDVVAAQAAGGVSDFTINTYNSGAKERLRISHDGNLSLYEDTGTTPKLAWSATNERLTLTGSDYQFNIQQGANQPWYMRAVSDGTFRLHINGTGDIITASATGIDVTGAATFSGTVNGLTLAPSASGNRWGVTAEVASNGVMEVGRYIDFHYTDEDTSDYGARLDYDGTNIVSTNSFYMGSGIYLGGSVAANLLNDYETGVFTPTLSFGGASVGITYSNQYGRYTKVGRQVTVQVGMYLTSKGTSTGGAVVSGLPFNVTTQAGGFGSYSGTFKGAGMASLSNATNVIADENTTTLLLEENVAAGAVALTNANFTNATYFMATVTYFN
jgi:hypothetical protein